MTITSYLKGGDSSLLLIMLSARYLFVEKISAKKALYLYLKNMIRLITKYRIYTHNKNERRIQTSSLCSVEARFRLFAQV